MGVGVGGRVNWQGMLEEEREEEKEEEEEDKKRDFGK